MASHLGLSTSRAARGHVLAPHHPPPIALSVCCLPRLLQRPGIKQPPQPVSLRQSERALLACWLWNISPQHNPCTPLSFSVLSHTTDEGAGGQYSPHLHPQHLSSKWLPSPLSQIGSGAAAELPHTQSNVKLTLIKLSHRAELGRKSPVLRALSWCLTLSDAEHTLQGLLLPTSETRLRTAWSSLPLHRCSLLREPCVPVYWVTNRENSYKTNRNQTHHLLTTLWLLLFHSSLWPPDHLSFLFPRLSQGALFGRYSACCVLRSMLFTSL